MWRRLFFAGLFAALLLRPLALYAEPFILESGPDRVTLLELYTSEGCSSCPPAEEWMTGLRSSHDLWKKLVPVAFHVDYWNDLGWKDALSEQAYSNLQRAHARRWGSSSVYTPMFVKNGKEFRTWFTEPGVPRTWRKKTGMLTVEKLSDGQWRARYQPQPSMRLAGDFNVHAALLGFDIRSKVAAGENRGRELVHDFAVLDMRNSRLTLAGHNFEAMLPLGRAPAVAGQRMGLAVWVTGADDEMLQAVGGYLPEEK